MFAREAFQTIGETRVVPDRLISPADVRDADALIVRSKTRVTSALLDGSRVSFVGTATAGTDHFDIPFLNARLIAWTGAPGCNADSVAEYVITALCCVAARNGLDLHRLTLGVIGVGQVGRRVVSKARALGLTVLENDPPLQVATGDRRFVSLDTLLRAADIITLHVPLTRGGQFPTHHLANCHFFEHAKPGCIFLNTSRGEVTNSDGLLFAMERHVVGPAILDVWENEPFISVDLLSRADLATPHIAGYSFEGRLNGTLAVYREACHFFEVEGPWTPSPALLPPPRSASLSAAGKSAGQILYEVTKAAYDIEADDRALREGPLADDDTRGIHFDKLRREYPDRREYAALDLRISGAPPDLLRSLEGLGFRPVRDA